MSLNLFPSLHWKEGSKVVAGGKECPDCGFLRPHLQDGHMSADRPLYTARMETAWIWILSRD